ncbi:PREDICTED: uncharacterized protein C7orf62 homolog [Haliaeetus leucocephalus]|uniref:uncharacterized protein C7orf62 homolog n=1 Tax=Haliaeetus leucocephalus TaxID=52644 RepID=UPI00053CD23A|nr:PREDICTED: uncharacterized protein C7orf62 homolog [Haliaeetus leucocephalus]
MSEEAPALGRPDSPEPAALERQNLLAVQRERLGRTGQCRFPLHRLLVVARLGEGMAAEDVAGYHRELFENALEDHSREQVSGLLLLYSSYILHVVEEIKVLVVAHNIPTRLFPDWYVAIATAPDDSEDTSESVHTLAPELLIPAETINYLCNAEECASPEDFLRIYLSPSQPALDSGKLHTV